MTATMNEDSSTFELPEYIHSRLQPQIVVDFPERDEERAILEENLPFADDEVLDYVVNFLQAAHRADESYSARDGINIARFALKLCEVSPETPRERALQVALVQTLGREALRYTLR
jgi:MoxR-like ATPase